jgi:hypothetical protein
MLDLLASEDYNLTKETWWFIYQYLPFFKEYLLRLGISEESFEGYSEITKFLVLNEYTELQVQVD